jgi:hypothetical protein
MAKPKIFLSFDYDHDLSLKGDFIYQARHSESPFSINDFSLSEPYPNSEWLSIAQSKIARCEIFIVLLGLNTRNAQGVLKEVAIAKGINRKRFQLKNQGKKCAPIKGAGETVVWTWDNIEAKLGRLMNRG